MSLSAHGLIPADLAERLGLAAGMRNILVHQYTEIDLDVVSTAAREGLVDLRRFGGLIGALLQEGADTDG